MDELSRLIVAVMLGFVSAFLIARFQAGREHRYRYATLKQAKFAEFVRLSRGHAQTLAQQMSLRIAHPLQRVDGVPALDSTDPIDHLSAEIALLAPERVWQASRDTYDALVALDAFAWDDDRGPDYLHGDIALDEYPARLTAFNSAMQRFLIEAKRDLGTLEK